MEFDIIKFKEAISNLITSIEYIQGVTDDFKKTTHTIHPLQREINEQQIFIDSQKGKYSDNIIAKLVEKKEVLNQKLQLIYEVELMFNQSIDDMYDFVQKYNFRPDKLKKYSDSEIVSLYNIYQISKKTNLSNCRKELYEYTLSISQFDLIELINTQFQLTGLKRFYLKDNLMTSYYCNDLKISLDYILDKNRFYLVKEIVNRYGNCIDRLMSPLEMLQAIISFLSRKNVSFEIPYKKKNSIKIEPKI